MELKINHLEFPTLESAWEGINEFMCNHEDQVLKLGGGKYGTELVCYDNVIHIFKPFISDKFNFGKVLGYRYKKWSKLINNYVDYNYLDLVKSEVLGREKKRASHYNYSFHFSNTHGSGKDCLISLTFCRRKGQKNPYVLFYTRASEVTSRLIFDFLLIQRMVEYVYGLELSKNVDVVCQIPFMYCNIERFLIYMAYKGRDCVKIHEDGFMNAIENDYYTDFQKKVLKRYDEFATKPLMDIKYKVHRRAAVQVQHATGHIPDLFTKDLTFPFNKKLKDKDIEKLNNNLTK
jgi:hypothetical protein